jgi:hypothetical protein
LRVYEDYFEFIAQEATMKSQRMLTSGLITALLLILTTGLAFARTSEDRASFGTSFTYQGQLKNGGTPYNGFCDFQFALYDALSGPNQVGTTLYPAAAVTGGYFTVTLDFGSGAFNGAPRWLEIWVTCPSGSGSFTQLNPRQAITAAPYAIYANQAATANSAGSIPWSGISEVPAGFADGIDNDTTYSNGAGLLLSGTTFSADTSYLQRRVSTTCAAGNSIRAIAEDGTVTCEADNDTTYTNGSGLTLSTNIFSIDPAYVQRRVSTTCAAGSSIRAIAQDGTVTCETDDNTTYTAGNGLTLDGTSFVVDKTITQMRVSSICAVGSAIRVITADGSVTCQAVSGSAGWSLTGNTGTDPTTNYIGTSDNQPLEIRVNALRVFRFEPNATSPNLLGGHPANWVTSGVYGATISGGGHLAWPNSITDMFGTIGGGSNNQAGNNSGNFVDAQFATVSGGTFNVASGLSSFIGGGDTNHASGTYSTIAGGWSNQATGASSTVAGGGNNTANGNYATVGGGYSNDATGDHSIIAGGSTNEATNMYSGVGGGYFNTATDMYAYVGGGYYNSASGFAATIPGGLGNQAFGDYSFAAGKYSIAYNQGCFVWSDSTGTVGNEVACGGDNGWVTRASDGYWLFTNSAKTSGATLAAGSGTWSALSDRNMKSNLAAVDARAVLEKVASMPITSWNYNSQDETIRHIGPMAQDFYAAFGVGEDDKHITTIDADGVALAAIQGLYAENQDLKTEVGTLKQEVQTLQQQNDAIETRLTALEQGGVTAVKSSLTSSLSWVIVVVMCVFGGGWVLRRRPGGEK